MNVNINLNETIITPNRFNTSKPIVFKSLFQAALYKKIKIDNTTTQTELARSLGSSGSTIQFLITGYIKKSKYMNKIAHFFYMSYTNFLICGYEYLISINIDPSNMYGVYKIKDYINKKNNNVKTNIPNKPKVDFDMFDYNTFKHIKNIKKELKLSINQIVDKLDNMTDFNRALYTSIYIEQNIEIDVLSKKIGITKNNILKWFDIYDELTPCDGLKKIISNILLLDKTYKFVYEYNLLYDNFKNKLVIK